MATDTRKLFYTTEKLGDKRELTPEGFLLCRDVAIARTGEMLYGPGETDIEPGPEGYVKIMRYPEDVFRPETMASFNGKPVTNDHPDSGVTPENWNALAVGTVMNPRRDGDVLLADLLITNQEAIEAVNDGKREVSCGYDVDYIQTGVGRGRQVNIIGNHVALVEQGRCGSRCAIKDHAAKIQGDKPMKKTWDQVWQGIKDKIRAAAKANDSAALEAALESVKVTKDDGEQVHVHFPEGEGGYTKDEINEMFRKQDEKHAGHEARDKAHDSAIEGLGSRVDKMEKDMAPLLPGQAGTTDSEEEKKKEQEMKDAEKELENEAPEGAKDKARAATDSAYMEESFSATVAMAEVIAPGIQLPTFDRAAKPKDTFVQVCNLRRAALTKALDDEGTRAIIQDVNGGKALDSKMIKDMPCAAVRTTFFGVGAAKKRANNAPAAVDTTHAPAAGSLTLSALNKKHREKFGN